MWRFGGSAQAACERMGLLDGSDCLRVLLDPMIAAPTLDLVTTALRIDEAQTWRADRDSPASDAREVRW